MGETFQRFQYGLLAFFLFFGESYGDPPHPGDCSNFGSECKYDANSHLDTIMHVNSLDECHQLCLDQEFCEFVTYYYDGNYENMCMLFRSDVLFILLYRLDRMRQELSFKHGWGSR